MNINSTGQKVLYLSKVMIELLEDPKPGLSTWNEVLGRTMIKLQDALNEMETCHPLAKE